MPDASLFSLHRTVWVGLMAALIAAGAYLQFPVAEVPFSMQPYVVLLAGFLLGPVAGPAAVGLYLVAGAIGLPVFAGGHAGLGYLLGPTGGFLLGFLPCALCAGLAATFDRTFPVLRTVLFGLLGLGALYGLGLLWLKFRLDFSWLKVLALILPFLPGDLIKLGLALATARFLTAQRLLPLPPSP